MSPFEKNIANNEVSKTPEESSKPENLGRRNFLVGAASFFGAAAVMAPGFIGERNKEKQKEEMLRLVQISFGETELSRMKVASQEFQRDNELYRVLSHLDDEDMTTLTEWTGKSLDVTSPKLTALLTKHDHPAFKDFVMKDCMIHGREGAEALVVKTKAELEAKLAKYDELLRRYVRRLGELQTEGKWEDVNLLRTYVEGQ